MMLFQILLCLISMFIKTASQPVIKMGGMSSQPCQTCKCQIKDAGIFAGEINCEQCSDATRTACLRFACQCGYCNEVKQMDTKAKIKNFYLCKECSGMVRSYLVNENYFGLEIMAAAIKGNGYTVPPEYLDVLKKAKSAVQLAKKPVQCDGCGMIVKVPSELTIKKSFHCDECAKDWREYRRQNMKKSDKPEFKQAIESGINVPN